MRVYIAREGGGKGENEILDIFQQASDVLLFRSTALFLFGIYSIGKCLKVSEEPDGVAYGVIFYFPWRALKFTLKKYRG